MPITEITLNKNYRFLKSKGYYCLYEGKLLRAIICKDGYLWCLEPELHDLVPLRCVIEQFFEVCYAHVRDSLNSCSFVKMLITEGSDFEKSCLYKNGRNLWMVKK